MQRSFARNFLLTDQTRNMLRNFGRYSRAKLFLRSYMWSVILLGFELSVKKVASALSSIVNELIFIFYNLIKIKIGNAAKKLAIASFLFIISSYKWSNTPCLLVLLSRYRLQFLLFDDFNNNY